MREDFDWFHWFVCDFRDKPEVAEYYGYRMAILINILWWEFTVELSP